MTDPKQKPTRRFRSGPVSSAVYTPASLGNLLAVVLQAIVSCNAEEADDIPV